MRFAHKIPRNYIDIKILRKDVDFFSRPYLREADFVGLIRSGYIGTHRIESDALYPIIAEVAKGNRALVLAWQKRIQGQHL